jgi:hypothetical protein
LHGASDKQRIVFNPFARHERLKVCCPLCMRLPDSQKCCKKFPYVGLPMTASWSKLHVRPICKEGVIWWGVQRRASFHTQELSRNEREHCSPTKVHSMIARCQMRAAFLFSLLQCCSFCHILYWTMQIKSSISCTYQTKFYLNMLKSASKKSFWTKLQ